MKQAIGVFDSGLGGLTVVKALMEQLPGEDIIYFGDTARVPYGTKSRETIIRFSQENARVLLDARVKMVVVACNSSSSCALPVLRQQCALPVLGVIDPGVRKALKETRQRRIGVIATTATIQSRIYASSLEAVDPRVEVFSQACPLFVPLVEEGWAHKAVTVEIAREYLRPLQEAGMDTLILGCTHYPMLRPVLREILGPKMVLIDSAQEVAIEVEQQLGGIQKKAPEASRRRVRFLLSDEPQDFQATTRHFLGTPLLDGSEISFECLIDKPCQERACP